MIAAASKNSGLTDGSGSTAAGGASQTDANNKENKNSNFTAATNVDTNALLSID